MKFIADIEVMPHKELLDPQGKAVKKNLHSIDIEAVSDVRVGKCILMSIEADSEEAAGVIAEKACKKLLANPIMENYSFKILPA